MQRMTSLSSCCFIKERESTDLDTKSWVVKFSPRLMIEKALSYMCMLSTCTCIFWRIRKRSRPSPLHLMLCCRQRSRQSNRQSILQRAAYTGSGSITRPVFCLTRNVHQRETEPTVSSINLVARSCSLSKISSLSQDQIISDLFSLWYHQCL